MSAKSFVENTVVFAKDTFVAIASLPVAVIYISGMLERMEDLFNGLLDLPSILLGEELKCVRDAKKIWRGVKKILQEDGLLKEEDF